MASVSTRFDGRLKIRIFELTQDQLWVKLGQSGQKSLRRLNEPHIPSIVALDPPIDFSVQPLDIFDAFPISPSNAQVEDEQIEDEPPNLDLGFPAPTPLKILHKTFHLITQLGKTLERFCFKTESCVHSFCSDCIGKHVATKIQESITTVTCPGLDCKSVIELDACREVLPKDVLDRWDEALCEALFGSQRFYCPFKDCSAMLLNDNEEGEAIRESECPFCHRLFCAVCYVPWHSGVDCEEFQRLNEDERGRDDLMLRELVKEKKWRRCPHCKYFVERTDGCLHMTCRCTSQFCYGCGAEWTSDHGGCQRD
ncbi:E3 ubiquitin-protein ligase RSL1 [Quercus suber]|uniref:E3 ubiquitin-protein ligase RSL1 n=1 Tax=Quercus suber TaxID=58331 RepID=UPI0032DF7A9F